MVCGKPLSLVLLLLVQILQHRLPDGTGVISVWLGRMWSLGTLQTVLPHLWVWWLGLGLHGSAAQSF